MKKSFIILSACLMLAGLSLAAPANNSETGFSIIQNGDVFQVLYKSGETYHVKVSIFNSGDKLLFTETLRGLDGFNRPYNLSHLSAGSYKIEIEDENGRSVRTVVVPEKKKRHRTFDVAPVHTDNGKFLLRVGKGSRGFSLTIYDKYGKELYHESKILDGDFAKVYNFSKVKGEVSVVVSDFNGNESKVIF